MIDVRSAVAVTAATGGAAAAVAAAVIAPAADVGADAVAWGLAGALGFGGLGALVITQRPRLAAGWRMLVVGVCSGGVSLAAVLAAAILPSDPGSSAGALAYWVQTWLWVPAYAPVPTLLLLVLPDGPLPGPFWRAATAVAAVANVLGPLAWALTPYDQQDQPVPAAYGDVRNPVGVDGAWSVVNLSLLLLVVSAVLGIASLVVRLRRTAGQERDQVLWVLAGALGTVLLVALAWIVPTAQLLLIAAALLPLPAAVTWALLRARLWDLDIALGRTLVYLALSLLALAVYGGLLVLAGSVLGDLTGQADLLVFALAAVLVQPARDGLQRRVNRLLYGDVVEPEIAIGELGRRVDSAASPAHVLPAVVDVLARTLRLPFVALRLPGREPVAHGTPTTFAETVPLVHQGRTVGELDLALPPGGLGPRVRTMLDELVRQTAQVAHAVLLQEEVQRSRESIVTSREEERRRLRHDLHDDLGPGLAATAMQLEAVGELLERDPGRAGVMLDQAAGYLRSTVAEVRRIVDDLRPAALGDLGLVGAVRAHAARLADGGLAATVDAPDDLSDLPAAAEVAAFRIVGEAMTNVARHARASRVHVAIRHRAGRLELCVEDDGVGVQPGARTGVGLGSMHQRAAELGGTCEVTGGSGTTVRATLPTELA
ncbi:sensor histidine kinase [Blastococcus sp. SYSU D01042]